MGQVVSNLEVFDNEISSVVEEIFFKPDLRRDIQFIFSISTASNNEDEVKFLRSVIKKTGDKNKVWVSFSDQIKSNDSVYYAFSVNIIELGVKYPGFASNKFLGTKQVNRRIFGTIKVEYSGNVNFAASTDSIVISYKDKVDIKDLDLIESDDYLFTRAKHPEVSFFEDIVFPASIIVVSVAAAILFFSIRSK